MQKKVKVLSKIISYTLFAIGQKIRVKHTKELLTEIYHLTSDLILFF